ncbi:MAG TPA: response regulator [Aurantimonas coralicida]|uniref:Response regulator n=2 Tax=root TaxID=1 RepID=A0A9C9NFD6_9HYPH|nr:response regulator [Aurantimonas coralicida]HEU00863.1 response regulator [Aurantimonas coralicida]
MDETGHRILIVEDEVELASIVTDYVLQAGLAVEVLHDGALATEWLLSGRFDLAVLDLMLPGEDGLTICRKVRRSSDVPIIMTTAKVEEIDRLLGLELGADDYVCKPYSPRELIARIKAVLRRTTDARKDEPARLEDRLVIDGDRWKATLDGQGLELTRREFQLLQVMVERPGRVFSRAQLLDLAFLDDADVIDRTIDSHMRNIRRKIGQVSDWDPIRSVYGVGYAYDA